MTAGLRAGSSNDGYIQVNGVDVLKLDSTGLVTFTKPPIVGAPTGWPVLQVTAITAQNLANGATTRVNLNAVVVDSALAWNNVNNRYTPQVPGWYQVSARTGLTVANGIFTDTAPILYKNGAPYAIGVEVNTNTSFAGLTLSAVVYLNGTTDYLELQQFQTNSNALAAALALTSQGTFLHAIFLRP